MSEEKKNNAKKVPEVKEEKVEFKVFLERIRKEHRDRVRSASVHMIESFLVEVVQLKDSEIVKFMMDSSNEDLFKNLIIQTNTMYKEGHFSLDKWKKAARAMAEDIVDGNDLPSMIIAVEKVRN